EFSRRHVQDLGLVRCHSRCRERRRPLQHRHVADETALVRDREFLFYVVPPLDDLYFATQDNSQTDVALPGFVYHLATLHDATLSEWLKQRKLMIVELGERDAFRITVKLLVLLLASHQRTLRFGPDNQSVKTHQSAGHKTNELSQLSLVQIGYGPIAHLAMGP